MPEKRRREPSASREGVRAGHLCDLLMLAVGVALLAIGLGVVPGAELPTVRPFLIAGWVVAVLGGLRLSAALPPRRSLAHDQDPRRILVA